MTFADSWPTVAEVLAGARLLARLPGFLRRPITSEQARARLRQRLDMRDDRFLAFVKRAIYENRRSPYRALLARAGCAYGDLERLVRREGVEGALTALAREGVRLTADEARGRAPVVRGTMTLRVAPPLLRNPLSTLHFQVRSSGSRGAPMVVGVDLASVREEAGNLGLALDARGGRRWAHAVWSVPGSSTVRLLLRLAACGAPAVAWFSKLSLTTPGLHPRYRWSARLLRTGGAVARVPIPSPVYVPLDDPLPIARWMSDVLRRGATPHLTTTSSAAIRLCRTAAAEGLPLDGAQFTLGGEATTAARLAAIRRAGAEALPRYSSVEAGQIGHGCLAPSAPDDVHLMHDRYAVIGAEGGPTAVNGDPVGLLVTTLSPTSPLVLLNVSLGDRGIIAQRACGCPLSELRWTTHLHTIHSDQKVTLGGITLPDGDVSRVLEESLPTRFGGGPTDYQLIEDLDGANGPRLRLRVHPSVGPVDAKAVVETFLNALGRGSGPQAITRLLWRDGHFLSVERDAPIATPSGKVPPVRHLRRA